MKQRIVGYLITRRVRAELSRIARALRESLTPFEQDELRQRLEAACKKAEPVREVIKQKGKLT